MDPTTFQTATCTPSSARGTLHPSPRDAPPARLSTPSKGQAAGQSPAARRNAGSAVSIEELDDEALRALLIKAHGVVAPPDWNRAQLLAAFEAPEVDASKALPEDQRRRRALKKGEPCTRCGSTDTWVTNVLRAQAYPAVIEMRRRYHKCGHCGRPFRTEGPL